MLVFDVTGYPNKLINHAKLKSPFVAFYITAKFAKMIKLKIEHDRKILLRKKIMNQQTYSLYIAEHFDLLNDVIPSQACCGKLILEKN